ncbi:hypothetical protein IV56_GL001928 [Lacticaseibacillus saniviri JCM 17471 = DSM 24301]|uniref:Uncharacterized protein n=1 Tax=Lacticaseibacillus saniviri JCM 17471 = DSM 24301 TaxID=1293598 RepID=A0A0R2MV44_9LACO|nr:hypothetical protein IV56_GL001928 [Lacticaseibacillus saniviri JCM 17471 = DSM 24301]
MTKRNEFLFANFCNAINLVYSEVKAVVVTKHNFVTTTAFLMRFSKFGFATLKFVIIVG